MVFSGGFPLTFSVRFNTGFWCRHFCSLFSLFSLFGFAMDFVDLVVASQCDFHQDFGGLGL